MNRTIQTFRKSLAKAAALLVLVSSAWIAPLQAFAQLLPPLPLPGGSLVVTIASPGSGSTVSGTVPVSASVSIVGSLTVASVQFRLDGANLGAQDISAPYSVSWNTTASGNGSHTLTAVARDLLGVQFTSAPVTVTVNNAPPPPPPDTTLPAVSVTSPASGATVSGITGVTASASDNVGVVGVQFRIDGTNFGAEDTSAPYSISWNTASATNGSHTITALARDAAGNSRISAPVTVTVANAPPPPPPDIMPPSVSITSPGNGQAVRATVTVTASASDNVGVVGVQFFGDGTPLGAEDITPPYSISVDTTASSNGSHVLTAVARDAAGNRTTSAPVTVTVSNTAPTVRYEETDPSIAYTAGWRPDAHGSLSGGAAAASNTPNARATFTFTGTSVSWIGGRSFETGIARVSLDGSFVAEVDTYSKTVEVQVPIFTAVGLANTSHTLMIEVTGRKNLAATAPWVLVDAFDVPPTTISRLQETDPSVTFTPGWLQGDTGDLWSGGTAAASITQGHQVTFTFTGTEIRWLSARGPQHGIARVFLDGAFMTEVDTYSASDPVHPVQVQARVFTATGLADASHTLTIEVTGRKNPDSAAAIVVVDAFEVTRSATRRQETDPAITYGLGWIQGNRDRPYSEGTAAVSTVPGAQATFSFTGTSVSWIGARGPQTGIARVILDGNVVADSFDTYAPAEAPQTTFFTLSGLAAGSHTLTIEVTGLKNLASTGASIAVDAFDFTP